MLVCFLRRHAGGSPDSIEKGNSTLLVNHIPNQVTARILVLSSLDSVYHAGFVNQGPIFVTLSMTAFARLEAGTPWGSLLWELRSVNHRYLEVNPRLPEELRVLEPQVREAISARLARGKVDCFLRFQAKDGGVGTADLDEQQVARMLAAARQIGRLADELAPLRIVDVLRWPGVLRPPPIDVDTLGSAALELLGQTLDAFIDMRRREGERMEQLVAQRLTEVASIVSDTRTLSPQLLQEYRERLETRLKELKEQLDPGRVEQEILLLAQKSDVVEELDRLAAHVDEVRNVFKSNRQIGRRLDFLMQELNREANTLASKAADLRVTNAAVALKVLIEQMREQVQNIE